jgi:hypothetical protein
MTDLAADNAGGQATWWQEIIDYELITGNAIWRFGLVLLVILLAMAGGRIAQYLLSAYAERRKQQKGVTLVALCCDSLAKPVYVAFFAAGIFLAKAPLRFDELKGLSPTIDDAWTKVAEAVAAIAFAYALYRLVDVAEYYLARARGQKIPPRNHRHRGHIDHLRKHPRNKRQVASVERRSGRHRISAGRQGYYCQLLRLHHDLCGQTLSNR